LRARFEEGREEPEQELAEFLADVDADHEEFWQKVKTNLRAGKVRLIFVADQVPAELRRIVEFLNQQMDPAEVLAVEIKQYTGQNMRTLVPRVIGQTVEAQQRKTGTVKKPSEKGEAYRAFFQSLIDRLRESYDFAQARAVRPQNWHSFASGYSGINYGVNFAQGGRFRADIYIDRGDKTSNKALFDALAEQRLSRERIRGRARVGAVG
jgi:hypothetical protein